MTERDESILTPEQRDRREFSRLMLEFMVQIEDREENYRFKEPKGDAS